MEEAVKNVEESPKTEEAECDNKGVHDEELVLEKSEPEVVVDDKTEVLSDNESTHSKENCLEERSPSPREYSKRSRSNSVHSSTDSEASVTLEREEGDGQESLPPKKVDDDEDKKNPQYIPKRGTFYEHDDRTADDNENEEEQEQDKNDKDGKKKVWQDKKEKWNHDRFNDNEQAPKSKSELIQIYGYDIRSEDGPPKARRRRRYGRGPNKYTRNWEDEDAYAKAPIRTKKAPPRRRSGERNLDQSNSQEDEFIEKSDDITEEETINRANLRPLPSEEYNKEPVQDNKNFNSGSTYFENNSGYKQGQRVGSGRVAKPNGNNNNKREPKATEYRGFTKPRNFDMKKDLRSAPKPNSKRDDYIHSQNFTNRSKPASQDLEKDMSKLSVNDNGGYKTNKYSNQRQVSVPPRLQNEQKGSKRYSSIRQRSLPESANPPFNQHSNYYPNEFSQQNQSNSSQQPPPQQSSQGIIQHQNTQIHTSGNPMPQIPPPPLAPLPQQVPVTSTPILQAPPQFPPSFPPPPPNFMQPGVAPPPFIPPPQTPQIINYVQGQPPQYPQPPFQGFQQQFNTVQQPAELYQPQGGITYYSPQDQQQSQRAVPLKRPKAAIPILPPPPPEPRGRGRANLIDSTNVLEGTTSSNQESNHTFEDASSAVTVEQ